MYPSVLLQPIYAPLQETLFILEKAGLFGTKAGEVYQVCVCPT